MPTKIAATSSMPSMKRSMRLGTRGGVSGVAMLYSDIASGGHGLSLPPPLAGEGWGGGSIGMQCHTCPLPGPPPQAGEGTQLQCRAAKSIAQYDALYCVSVVCSSLKIASGSPPAFLTLSAQLFCSGSAALRHSPSCSGVIE